MKMIAKRAAVCAAALATMAGGALAVAPGANAAPSTQTAVSPDSPWPPPGGATCGFTSWFPRVGYHYVTSGNAVREVQCKLVDVFHISVGSSGIDGIFGADTHYAVIRFQNTHGLYPDGIVGPNTWRALGY